MLVTKKLNGGNSTGAPPEPPSPPAPAVPPLVPALPPPPVAPAVDPAEPPCADPALPALVAEPPCAAPGAPPWVVPAFPAVTEVEPPAVLPPVEVPPFAPLGVSESEEQPPVPRSIKENSARFTREPFLPGFLDVMTVVIGKFYPRHRSLRRRTRRFGCRRRYRGSRRSARCWTAP